MTLEIKQNSFHSRMKLKFFVCDLPFVAFRQILFKDISSMNVILPTGNSIGQLIVPMKNAVLSPLLCVKEEKKNRKKE